MSDASLANLPIDYPYERDFDALPRLYQTEEINLPVDLVLDQGRLPVEILGTALTVLIGRQSGVQDVAVGVYDTVKEYVVVWLMGIDLSKDSFEDLLDRFSNSLRGGLDSWEPLSNVIRSVSRGSQLPSLNRSIFCACVYGCEADLSDEKLFGTCDLHIFITRGHKPWEMGSLKIKYNACIYCEKRIRILSEQLIGLLRYYTSNEGRKVPGGKMSLLTPLCKDIIPDPTADLNFDRFEGHITDIFSANAKKIPDEICVRETGPGINYTYGDIERATNSLANYFESSGLVRGDVVGIYSCRGVELVVAVIGALKAGLTYFVVDPAYPEDRQIVYIRSADPKAFVFLSHAGATPAGVIEYISSRNSGKMVQVHNLELSTETKKLKAMSKIDSGLSEINFSSFSEIEGPKVALGPDTIATLSFTSGSTGLPKGVLGRHFSLTHFYPFMSERFGIGKRDRFAMLSGISHDPIQRDIFTPLYFGASLYIPTHDDIAVSGKLATWVRENKVTVVHLTPAMGKLLTSQTRGITVPSLRNAFFVGDFLLRGDVEKLRELCPNVDVTNMYGSTETQRAVAYYHMPSRSKVTSGLYSDGLCSVRDIVPLGIGMKDVQLLVVNKFNELCGVGELGEVYVRSPGIAGGYLDKEESSAKFINNWFNTGANSSSAGMGKCNNLKYEDNYYMGFRDRMYRTGDIGFYRSDGNVECMGRTDDQVKIRGFRIELREVYAHMASCPLVSESVITLHQGEDGDKYLVGYFTPSCHQDFYLHDKMLESIKAIREHMKTKLPSYAVPKFIAPIVKIPLTPNGKVDKKKLPDPLEKILSLKKLSGVKTADDKKYCNNSIHGKLPADDFLGLVASILSVPKSHISLSDNFFDLGGHSILATKLHCMISARMGSDVKLHTIYSSDTLGDMLDALGRESADTSPTEKPEVPYSEDFNSLSAGLADIIDSNIGNKVYTRKNLCDEPSIIFLTGATGFLGSFVLISILKRYPKASVINLVRAKDTEKAMDRIISSLRRNPLCDEKWFSQSLPRIKVIKGDLFSERLGLGRDQWDELCRDVDVIVHNGAFVHWLYPYGKLRKPNTLSTVSIIEMACMSKIKPLLFVSSTSVFDTPKYLAHSTTSPIYEDDTLEMGKTGLDSGYAQSKWVSEKLILLARSKGHPSMIIRPGYIFGDSVTGIVNTDDFLWRLAAGCVGLGSYPRLPHHINVYPVDHVADLIACIVGDEDGVRLGVFNVWNKEHFTMESLFDALSKYYDMERLEYSTWRELFKDAVSNDEDNKLYPFFSLAFGNLPALLESPRLDDVNTTEICARHTLTPPSISSLVHVYIGYLCRFGFIPPPSRATSSRRGGASEHTKATAPPVLEEWSRVRGAGVFRRSNT